MSDHQYTPRGEEIPVPERQNFLRDLEALTHPIAQGPEQPESERDSVDDGVADQDCE